MLTDPDGGFFGAKPQEAIWTRAQGEGKREMQPPGSGRDMKGLLGACKGRWVKTGQEEVRMATLISILILRLRAGITYIAKIWRGSRALHKRRILAVFLNPS